MLPKEKTKVKEKKEKFDLASIYSNTLDEIEKEYDLENAEFSPDRLSTGLLSVDLVTGGGPVAGLMSISGPEASAKSTLAQMVLKSAVKNKVPIIQYRDAEGTLDSKYGSNILGIKSLEEVFGRKDDKGTWVLKPKGRYYDDSILEKLFDSLTATFNKLPDKRYRKKDKQWYLVFDKDNKKTKPLQDKIEAVIDFDKPLYQQTKKYWYPVDSNAPQAVIIVDSWPALLLKNTDEDEESSNALAMDARAFSKNLKRIVGKFKAKRIICFGVNQIRENPAARFTSPFYEPCGNALKFYSSMRNEIHARTVPEQWKNGPTTKMCEEVNIFGKKDYYAFKHFKNTKNKTFTPFLECWTRIWVRDSKGSGRGFDMAFDTYEFLRLLGIVSFGRNKITFAKLPKEYNFPFNGESIAWADFKFIIYNELGEYEGKTIPKTHVKMATVKLRKWCNDLAASGKATEWLFENPVENIKEKKKKS